MKNFFSKNISKSIFITKFIVRRSFLLFSAKTLSFINNSNDDDDQIVVVFCIKNIRSVKTVILYSFSFMSFSFAILCSSSTFSSQKNESYALSLSLGSISFLCTRLLQNQIDQIYTEKTIQNVDFSLFR